MHGPVEVGLDGVPLGKRIGTELLYHWRKEYSGLEIEQAKWMKDLEKENTRLKRLVADLSLEKQALNDISSQKLVSSE